MKRLAKPWLVTVCVLMMLSNFVHADTAKDPTIYSAVVDYKTSIITITGTDFVGADPIFTKVTLGGVQLTLAQPAGNTQILANLPKNSPAGTYPLVVSNNAGGGVVSTPFSLTIQNGNGNGGGTSTSSTTNIVILRVVPDYVQNKLSIVGTNFQGQTGTDVPSVTVAGILWPPA